MINNSFQCLLIKCSNFDYSHERITICYALNTWYTSEINWWNKNITDSYAIVLTIIRTSMNGDDNNNNQEKKNMHIIIIASK